MCTEHSAILNDYHVHRTQCYTKQLSKSECIRSFMCDKSWLWGTSNVHEHYVSDTAEPKRADEAQLAQRLINGTDDFELINLKPWSSLFIISLAQRTVIPTLCPSWSTTFIFRRLQPESLAEKIGRRIEQYKILLEWKWLIQTLLRINTEKMHKPRETCVLFVNKTLQNVVTVPDSVSRWTECAVYNFCSIYQHTHFRRTNTVCLLRNTYRPAYLVSSPQPNKYRGLYLAARWRSGSGN